MIYQLNLIALEFNIFKFVENYIEYENLRSVGWCVLFTRQGETKWRHNMNYKKKRTKNLPLKNNIVLSYN